MSFSATSLNGLRRIRAVQVDGGSEFAAECEQAASNADCACSSCPRAPPDSTAPSNAPTVPTPRSFYQVTPYSLELKKLNRELRHWERTYNTVRLHQALGYLTPRQFLHQLSSQRKE